MTEAERDLLMPFLRNLVQTQTVPADEAATHLIRNALGRQPHATYLLVQRALTLECALADARRKINVLEGRAPATEAPVVRQADFLNAATSGWGQQGQRVAAPTTSKRLYDFFKETQARKEMDLESRAISFLNRNSGKVWAFILMLTVVVVFMKERGL